MSHAEPLPPPRPHQLHDVTPKHCVSRTGIATGGGVDFCSLWLISWTVGCRGP